MLLEKKISVLITRSHYKDKFWGIYIEKCRFGQLKIIFKDWIM